MICTNKTVKETDNVWVIDINLGNKLVQALIDSGASKSFIAPRLASELELELRALEEGHKSKGVQGNVFEVNYM